MSRTVEKDELIKWSNEELLEQTKDRAVTFHLFNKGMKQLCVNDLRGYDAVGTFYFTRSGINIEQKYVESLEIF